MKLRTIIGVLAATATAALALPAHADSLSSPATEAAFRVYLSPTGDDTRTGLTEADAIKTLDRAEQIIDAALDANALDSDVEVRIKPGTYHRAAGTYWTTMVPDHKITFLPTTDNGTTPPAGELPLFVGPTDGSAWAKDHGVYWFFAAPSVATGPGEGLHFRHLKVQNYSNGIAFQGGTTSVGGMRRGDSTPFNNNSLEGMSFYRLGDRWNWNGDAPSPKVGTSTALRGNYAVALSNSSDNTFEKSSFRLLESIDIPGEPGDELDLIHAFYIKDWSHGNLISDNQIDVVSGSPIKARNDAHSNTVTNNSFYHAGAPTDGVYYDRIETYKCETGAPSGCTSTQPSNGYECPSHGNKLTFNRISAVRVDGRDRWTGYRGQLMDLFERSPYGTASTGSSGCSNVIDGATQHWLVTGGNEPVL